MLNFVSPKSDTHGPTLPDAILSDLPRGENGRPSFECFLPYNYFEAPSVLEEVGYREGTDIFLGVVNATTEKILRPDGRWENRTTGGCPVGICDDRNISLVAGARSGKGRSIIIPNLIHLRSSILCIDVKSEAADLTACYRAEKLGQKVCILDPFRASAATCAPYRSRFNPLATLTLDNPTLVEDAGMIADAIIVPGNADDKHWDVTARIHIQAVLLHIVTFPAYFDERTLKTAYELLSGARMTQDQLLDEMLTNSALNNYVVGAARTMKDRADKERSGILSTVAKNIEFLSSESVQEMFSGHDFSLDEMKQGAPDPGGTWRGLTVYLVLEPSRLATCSQFLRLMVNLGLISMERCKSKPPQPCLWFLDEFASLGRMESLEKAAAFCAGYSVRLFIALQDLTQLKALYRDRYETFLANSGVIQFFGNNDQFTVEWISKYLGQTSITVTDTNSITSDQRTKHGATGQTQRQQTQELLTASEIRRFLSREDKFSRQLVLVAGRRPYILQRATYDQHELFRDRIDAA